MKRVASHRFDFGRSRLARAFVLVSHGATTVLLLALPLDAALVASTALLVAALGAREWRCLDQALAGIVVRSDASAVALCRDGRACEGRLVSGSIALPALAVVAWRREGDRRVRFENVPRDRLAPDGHRALRAMLRYATSGDDADAPASHARASMSIALSALGWPARRCR
jgi:hypothetical protein